MLQDLTAYDEGEGPDIDEETAPDQVSNEVEIMGKRLWAFIPLLTVVIYEWVKFGLYMKVDRQGRVS